jgi:predicted patatin/cPLA2 family phospholipase
LGRIRILPIYCQNLPLIFENFKYGNKFYIDGGIADNFPIDKAEELGKKILGINIVTNLQNFSEPEKMNILEYIYKLIFIPMDQIVDYKIAKFAKKSKIINLDYDKLKFFNFTIPSKDKLDIFSSGYEQMKTHFEDFI